MAVAAPDQRDRGTGGIAKMITPRRKSITQPLTPPAFEQSETTGNFTGTLTPPSCQASLGNGKNGSASDTGNFEPTAWYAVFPEFPLLIPRLNGCLWVMLIPLLLRPGRVHCILVSAMELDDGGAAKMDSGSGAFEFIRKGSGRKRGRLGHFAQNLDLSPLIGCGQALQRMLGLVRKIRAFLGGSERRDAIL